MASYPPISLNTDTALLLNGLGLPRRLATAPLAPFIRGVDISYRGNVDSNPVDNLRNKLPSWIADLEEEVVEQQRKLGNMQKALKALKALASDEDATTTDSSKVLNGLAGLQTSVNESPDPKPKQNLSSAGFPAGMTRRQALWQVIPEFDGEPFESGDLRKRLVEKFPDAHTRNLPQSIANLLQDMVKKGELEDLGKRGDGATDPHVYREVRDNEDSFALE